MRFDAFVTTIIQGSPPLFVIASTMSYTSPRASGSPPEACDTTGRSSRQIAAYSAAPRRSSLIGPPQLQCQQFAVQACVISNETESGLF